MSQNTPFLSQSNPQLSLWRPETVATEVVGGDPGDGAADREGPAAHRRHVLGAGSAQARYVRPRTRARNSNRPDSATGNNAG